MIPVTESLCGTQPADLFKNLMTLGFKNTEIIYTSLGLQNIWPDECRALGVNGLSTEITQDQESVIVLDVQDRSSTSAGYSKETGKTASSEYVANNVKICIPVKLFVVFVLFIQICQSFDI